MDRHGHAVTGPAVPPMRTVVLLAILACRRAASAAGAGSTHASGTPARFLLSAYHSAGKVQEQPAGDLADPAVLQAALAARSFRSEVIVTSFNGGAVDVQYHMSRQLQQHAGYHHFLSVAPDERSCNLFRAHWNTTPLWPGCGWLTLPGDATNEAENVYRLWLRRYKLIALVLERGYNVFLADNDVIIHRDFYAEAKHTALAAFNLFIMHAEINGGLLYIQNVHPDGPIVWMFHEIVRRGVLIYDFMDATGDVLAQGCTPMDQAWLQYLLFTLSNGINRDIWLCLPLEGVNATWQKLTPPGQTVPLPPENEAQRHLGMAFVNTPLQPPLSSRAVADVCRDGGTSDLCARLSRFVFGAHASSVEVGRLPFFGANDSSAVETVVQVPSFVFGTWESTLAGWDDGHAPFAAVVHLVVHGNSFSRTQKGGHNNRWWLIQSHGLWYGKGGGSYSGPSQVQAQAPRYLGLHPDVAASLNVTESEYEALIVRVAAAAASAGRIPVIPAVPCSVAWMPRSPGSRYGVSADEQARYRAMSNGQCYPLADYHGSCTLEVAMPQCLLDGAAVANAGGLRHGANNSTGGVHVEPGQLGGETADVVWLRLEDLQEGVSADVFASVCPDYAVAQGHV